VLYPAPPSLAPEQGVGDEGRQRVRELLWVALTACGFTTAYALTSLFRHWRFGSGYDLGIFDQAVWLMSRFEAPRGTISGYANILGDHFSPILALLAPLYWIAPAPETLLVTQAVLLGGSIFPVYLFLRDRLSMGQSLALCGAYGCFWGLQRTALSDFHELAFAPLLTATAVLAISRGRWTLLWIVSAILCLVKEDLIPLVFGFGLYLVYLGEYRRGVLLAMSSLAAFIAVVSVVIPWFGSNGWAYAGVFGDVTTRPWTIPVLLVTPIEKLRTLIYWLAPFAFLPVRSPYAGLIVPLAAGRLLSEMPVHWGHGGHYSAPLAPLLAMAAGDTLGRLASRAPASRRRARLVNAVLGLSLVTSIFLPGHQPFLRLFIPRYYETFAMGRVADQALSFVGPSASVVAQVPVLPHLSHRREIHLLRRGAPDADFVVAAAHLDPWPNASRDEINALLEERRRQGYVVLFESDGWIVLRAPGAPRSGRVED
jgi:uncharacterized membrane protein